MQKYINEMSENGYHLENIGKFRCSFNEQAGKRFIYALSGAGEETLYASNNDWEHFLTHKNVPFFRQELRPGAVRVTRTFKNNQRSVELSWLGSRLAEGLVLVAKDGNDYYFNRSDAYKGFCYHVKSIGKVKKPKKKKQKEQKEQSEQDVFAAERLMRFVCVCGSDYYFVRDASVQSRIEKERGSRITDMLLAIIASTGSAIAFTASLIFMLFGTFSASTNGKSTLPFLIGGGSAALLFGILFVLFFLKFQKVVELRRIRAEEERARLEAQQNAPPPPPPAEIGNTTNNNNRNTVVMNTVVVNSYGKNGKKTSTQADVGNGGYYHADSLEGSSEPDVKSIMGQVFENTPLDPVSNPSLLEAGDPQELARAVMKATSSMGRDYEDKTENDVCEEADEWDESDIWQGQNYFGRKKTETQTAALSAPSEEPVYDVRTEKRSEPQYGSDEDEDESYDEDYADDGDCVESFPLLTFIACALLAFASLIGFIFSVRYCIFWLISGGNVLLLVLSILGLAFAPFLFHFGVKSCKELLNDASAY